MPDPIFVPFERHKAAVYETLIGGMVYGAYIVVYATSVYILLRSPGFTSSPPRMFMFGITTFMFALGIVALVLVTTLGFKITQMIFYPTSNLHVAAYYYAWASITCLMYILCDIICAWRTVVLWNKDKRVIAILLLFILGTIAAAGYCHAGGPIEPGNFEDNNLKFGKRDTIMIGPTLVTNLLSTTLLAWKAWERRISVRKHLREGSKFVRADRVFALLIESGIIYCCIWILYCISAFGVLPSPGFTTMAFVSGLYPTLIIILVSMQMSPVEHYSSPKLQFARVPGLGPPRASGTPRHVVTIHREYTSDFVTQIPSTVLMKSSDEESSLSE
ncbi:hypothetical protein V8E53_013017 [Lactarius tabidus]